MLNLFQQLIKQVYNFIRADTTLLDPEMPPAERTGMREDKVIQNKIPAKV